MSVRCDPLVEAVDAVGDLRLRGCLQRSSSERERLAAHLYDRLHPVMSALGLLFLVLVLAETAAREGMPLHTALLVASWLLWFVFAVEYVLRLVIAPSTARFLRRTWWQLAFLAVPFLTMLRALLVLRLGRPTRVMLAAIRGSTSARATLSGRAAWIGVVTTIVVFAAADLLHAAGDVRPYGRALHAVALSTTTGEPLPADTGLAQLLDVALAVYAVAFFAVLAGIVGAYFIERGGERRSPISVSSR